MSIKRSLRITALLFCLIISSTSLKSVPSYAQTENKASVSKSTKKTKTNKKTITVKVGKKKKLTLNTKSDIIKWSTSNKKIATVDKNGKIKGIKAGKCVISAETKDTIYKCNILVEKVTAQAVTQKTYSSDEDFINAFVKLQKKADKNINFATTNAQDIHTNRVIVGGEPDLTGLKDVEILKSMWGDYVIQFNDAESAKKYIDKEKDNKKISFITEEKVLTIDRTIEDNRIGSSVGSWGTEYVGADIMSEYILVQGLNKEVVAAVVDTGVDGKHPFLSERMKSGGYDLVDGDNDPSDLIQGHGTHVSGTIVDCTPSLSVKILPVRVLNYDGRGYSYTVSSGIKYAADHGANVINLSLGGMQCDDIDNAVRYAVNKGVIVVAAAGNDSMDCSVCSPSHLKECIVVSAIDSKGTRASFTNYGKSVDVAAPGVSIYSSIPNGKFSTMSGTSMAAPHVSAAAAMIKMMNPSYSPDDVEKWIAQYATDLGVEGRDDIYGNGALNLDSFIPETVTGIEISQLPKKLEYVVGESLNSEGLKIKVKYSKGADKIIEEGFSCSPTSFEEKGEQKIVVTYRGCECSFSVKVTDNIIKTLEVASQPVKVEYYKGDTLDTTGLSLIATYKNGKKENINNGFVCSPMVLETVGSQMVTVEYKDSRCEFYVNVKENRVKSIAVSSEPNKKEYWIGENVDVTGLSLIAEYSNGTKKEITEGFYYSPTVLTTVGQQTIEITYENCTCTFTVMVKDLVLEGISVSNMPDKTEYFDGEKLDVTGLILTGKYSNGTEKPISEGFTCSPDYLSLSSLGQNALDYKEKQRIEVRYKGKETTFDVTVKANSAVSVSVANQPSKRSYYVGDTIDTNGMVLSVTFANGTKLNIDKGYSISPTKCQTAGNQTVTVEYGGVQTTYSVTVEELKVKGIRILSYPSTTMYKKGDTLNTYGLSVCAVYSDGSEKILSVSDLSVSPKTLNVAGTQVITVSYAGYTATFNVTVSNPEFTVSFNGNGGTPSYTSKKVISGNKYGDLPTAQLDYYTFAGWYTAASGGTKITAGTIVSLSSNQTLYAHWDRNGFGNWSGWTSTPVSSNGNREVETRTVEVSYNMGTIVCGNSYGSRCWLAYMQSGYTRRAEDYTTVFTKAQLDSATQYAQGSYFDYWDGTACDGYIIGPGTAYVLPGDYIPYFVRSINYGTEYRYRDRIK